MAFEQEKRNARRILEGIEDAKLDAFATWDLLSAASAWRGMAVPARRRYVADSGHHRVLRFASGSARPPSTAGRNFQEKHRKIKKMQGPAGRARRPRQLQPCPAR